MGKYMAAALEGKPFFMTPFLGWAESLCYQVCKINPHEEMNWKDYLKCVLRFNLLGFILLFLIQIFQGYLPLNPQGFSGVPWDLAFNTAASFVTNTNWQAYSGETTLSYFTQMVGLTTQNFVSAATGISVLMALIRGFKGRKTNQLGNFWADLTRTVIYILLPLSIILSVILVSQGVVQSLKPYMVVETLENETQMIPLGPAASQVAIKQLGTNGGGFFGANSAHPLENPTAITNFCEHLAIILIPAGLFFTFGYLINSVRQGALFFYVVICFWALVVCAAEITVSQSNPSFDVTYNLEGIDTRIGISKSFFWTMSTTDTANGSSNASISSMPPLTSGLALFNLMLGEVIMGGAGVGLCGFLKFVLLAVFIAGLMVGRTPEFLGKKIEKAEILWVTVALLAPCALILIGSAISCITPAAVASVSQGGPHGYTEILYAFASAVGNNGSALNGLNANTVYYNVVLGFAMLLARIAIIIPSLAIAGGLAQKRYYPPSQGTLETDTLLFGILLASVIFILGALSFFPALILGPILENFLMMRGVTF